MTKRKNSGRIPARPPERVEGTASSKHDSRVKELEDRIIHIQADFENYRKRLEKQKAESEARASESIIRDLLEVVDDFMHAISKAGDDCEGFKRIYDKFMHVMGKHGLKPIEAKGNPFDHYYHEAVMSQKSDKEEGTVIEELQKGFMLNSRVIRHSKVKVAKE